MKILHVINSLATGGAEKLIVETVPLYAAQGIEVDVLLLNGTGHPLLDELRDKKCCRIFSLGTYSVYNPLLIFKMVPYFSRYDLVHVHLFPAQYYAIAARWLSFSKKPFVFTEHSTSNRRFVSKKYRFVDGIIYRSYNKIICITDRVKEAVLKQAEISGKKVKVIENGINIRAVTHVVPYSHNELGLKLYLDLSDQHTLLLQVSSFQEPKDQPTVIRALQYLPPCVKLLLAGDGILRKECEQLVEALNLQRRVFFLGIRDDIPALLKSCDIIVLSSKYEGLSLSSIEGMASGKPFIASDVPGLSEVVAGAGILFPSGNDQKLAEEILKLMNDKEYYYRVAQRCLQRSAQFDIHKMVARHIELYRSLLK